MHVLRAAAAAAVVALLALLVWDVAHHDGGGAAKQVDEGKVVPAPVLRLPHLSGGGRFDLASLRGKVVVVNFWASWCVPCKAEAKDLVASARHWRGKDVVFVGVDAQDFSGAARRFVSRYGVDYPIVRDGRGSTLGHWGITGFPETFLVDRRGRIRPPHVSGPVDRGELDAAIQRALSS
jgi:cytochrome c biogenesis protein CcmG/thiol:disulfide interchange protein DsbE